jgi:Ohr subfamily peroxiredoxin
MQPIYTATVTTSGSREGAIARSDNGKLDLKLDFPPELGGKGEGTNPEQLFAAGYSACFASAVKAVAGKQKVDTGAITTTARVTIGKNDNGEGFALAVKLEVNLAALSKEEAQKLVTEAHKICPYSNATRNNIAVEITVG